MAFESQYPPAQSDTYVKATTKFDTSYWPYFATDPALSVIGSWANNGWLSQNGVYTNQRFHIDLGSAKTITRLYYENGHSSGSFSDRGANNFTFWGSNTAGSFAELTYATDTGWTQISTYSDAGLTTPKSTFDQHVALNQADPKYIYLDNSTAYRYYAIKIADTFASTTFMAVRRFELQTGTADITENHSGVSVGPMVMIE